MCVYICDYVCSRPPPVCSLKCFMNFPDIFSLLNLLPIMFDYTNRLATVSYTFLDNMLWKYSRDG